MALQDLSWITMTAAQSLPICMLWEIGFYRRLGTSLRMRCSATPEDYGSDWTPDLLEEFQRRRGYDLTPHLPALAGDAGPTTAAIRHDWGETLSELADERFLQPIHEWAQQHHTLFRSQTYGFPPVTLSSNRYEDLPEGEGKATIRWARLF